ncbi:sodium ion-translocating decarboxylase subunit beta [Anaerocolumna sedimenticola]|uniref:Sodium ion-translocating decarboxylase subunit beta n=1 Tax=Anaerocolumna sedimenticola TaxID=2696063 RepID=A0A6P1TKQ5_9FIRM|nr:sodium ion-translocating decarboxylase subunit beta [Anaerocolumna sedimenticola]QHQ61644.1 sodium ion-translocating decarboxylase subunit beta [Anaerocolumna sedimenticola]
MSIFDLFQGIGTMFSQDADVVIFRILLILLGILLVYLGAKKILEPLIMIPMGFGMSAINAGVLFLEAGKIGNLFIDPLVTNTDSLMNIMQIDFLQPIYTFTFSNGLIACLVFMGIGVITDIGMVLAHPFIGMIIAMCAELGTVATFPIAKLMGFTDGEAAAVSIIGGADGPMVLFTSLTLAKDLFVPITIVAYLYLSLTYGGYPFLIRLLIPKNLRGKVIVNKSTKVSKITSREKLVFAVAANTLLCLLFPVAAPLFLSFFIGIAIRESGLEKYTVLIENIFLYASTFFLGLMLGVLCDANTILNPKILKLLLLGMLALLLSGIGGILGGYIVYLFTKKNFNPVIGIAGVSCVPTTAKVAQKEVSKANKMSFVMEYALSANICGVITTAILTGIYVTLISKM